MDVVDIVVMLLLSDTNVFNLVVSQDLMMTGFTLTLFLVKYFF